MSYVNKIVRMSSTEKDFMKAFINELTTADSRIVCETDIDAEFENEDTSHIVTIILNVNNCYKLKISRGNYLGNVCSSYTVKQIINEIERTSAQLYYSNGYMAIDAIAIRNLKLTIISNDNFIIIRFGSYSTSQKEYVYSTISYHEDEFNIATNDIAGDFICTDENTIGESYKIVNRLLYSRGEDVEIIESKTLLQSESAVRDMKNVFDCSNVIANSILLIDNNKYFAVDSNTLVKIKE